MAEVSKAVLITGCSTGIGRATAERLAGAGHTVYATARRLESIEDLEAKGCRTLALDVTDEESMRAAVAAVEQAEGAVGVLVNNAGYSQSGAIEDVPIDAGAPPVRDQRVRARPHVPAGAPGDAPPAARADRQHQLDGRQADVPRRRHLPRHQARRRGHSATRCGSRSGLRDRRGDHRARPDHDGVRRTPRSTASTTATAGERPYAEFNRSVAEQTTAAYEGPMARFSSGPESVARAIEKAIASRRPKPRYVVTAGARVMPSSPRRALPDLAAGTR